jgi:DMSO reductase family type II enzyme heme b subunit
MLDPAGGEWRAVSGEQVHLEPTPLTAQPSRYVQASWRDRPYGRLTGLHVKAAHNGDRLFFHLAWDDETRDDATGDTDRFVDAACVLFPSGEDAPLAGMGSPEQPVVGWFWRPDLDAPLQVMAQGTGTTRRNPDGDLRAAARFEPGGWRAVISGLRTATPPSKVAFAVWQGANSERAGLKAATMDWHELRLEE